MALVKNLFLVSVIFWLISCDYFPGPTVINELQKNAEINILYIDGTFYSHSWKPCQSLHLGAIETGKWGVEKKDNVFVERIIIKIRGEVIHAFDKKTLHSFLSEKKDILWGVNESGIYPSSGVCL